MELEAKTGAVRTWGLVADRIGMGGWEKQEVRIGTGSWT